ncbi:AAA family ATPase [uncultured Haemophilus sp.]|uniref:AAA family ATPase n=1 Tax=uncultured Haemophilus sp. TaxID=237779 RepID=UPI0025D20E96|nr:AAA family ATPase [uncultured Haemophilus sp.]
MKVIELTLKEIAGIKFANIKFDNNMNIICGPNGIGKTTIINSLSHCFLNGYDISRAKMRIASKEIGYIKVKLNEQDEVYEKTFNVSSCRPGEKSASSINWEPRKFISIGVERMFEYTNLDSIERDSVNGDYSLAQHIANGIPLRDMKNWFANRSLFSGTEGALGPNSKRNLGLAKQVFSILDECYSYSRTDAKTFDIFVNTANGEIWYEYLSSGFKSCLTLIWGIIKEIEWRFQEQDYLVREFDGIIVIDELELHLHPEWQTKIYFALQEIFPNVQFIITTHSPHIVQSAKGNQIIALAADNEGITYVRELPNIQYGYQGWTLDEVLQDVMGMRSTYSDYLDERLDTFYKAIDEEDLNQAKVDFKILNQILHPNNPLRKMINIDFKSIGGDVND